MVSSTQITLPSVVESTNILHVTLYHLSLLNITIYLPLLVGAFILTVDAELKYIKDHLSVRFTIPPEVLYLAKLEFIFII